MYLEDWAPQRPFALVKFPETTSDAYQEVKLDQLTPITDMDAFTVYNTWLLQNETLRVTVRGDTSVRVRGIDRDYPVVFKKTLTMPGLRLLQGTVVRDASISLRGDAQGNNFKGMVDIPNHSLVSFELVSLCKTQPCRWKKRTSLAVDCWYLPSPEIVCIC